MNNVLKKLLYKEQKPVLILNAPKEYSLILKEISALFILFIFFSGYIELSADSNNLNWSSNQGFTSWNKARSKCARINMRLPIIEELKSAHKTGVTESWKKNGNGYWSSTISGDSTSYSFDISHGTAHADERRFSFFVRCVK